MTSVQPQITESDLHLVCVACVRAPTFEQSEIRRYLRVLKRTEYRIFNGPCKSEQKTAMKLLRDFVVS